MTEANYFDLIEASKQPGCPICRLSREATRRYLASLFYEMVNDAESRKQLRDSLGFCAAHAAQILDGKLRDPLGLSIIYQDVVNHILARLPEEGSEPEKGFLDHFMIGGSSEQSRWTEKVLEALTPEDGCPACEYNDEQSWLLVDSLLANLEKDEVVQALDAGEGLCQAHLRAAVKQATGAEQAGRLVSIHRAKLERLRGELGEFVRKSDYRFGKEGYGSEGDAYRRAMEMLAGSDK